MSPILKRRPENRLSKRVRLPGGQTVAQMEADIQQRMEGMRHACVQAVRQALAEIEREGQSLRPPLAEDSLARLYALSNQVIELSGAAELPDLDRAALSLCQLVDGWRNGKAWSAAAWSVHLLTLQLLARSARELSPQARDAMIEGLTSVVVRTFA